MVLNSVCYRTFQFAEPAKLAHYQQLGGYRVWQQILTRKITAEYILQQIQDSKLQGRGGAGFALELKLQMVKNKQAQQKYVICNADEGEPGSFKDRDILTYNPHQIIEGMAIAGYAIGATVGYIYIRGEYAAQIAIMETALQEAIALGMLGQNLQNSGIDFQIYCFVGAGAYICGEETALIASMEGKRGQPKSKPPFPGEQGLYGKPTLLNNTETLASIPVILQYGGKWYLDLGVNKAKGCKIFSVSGAVINPGNYETSLGISFLELLQLAGGMQDGKKLKAVIPGGISTPVLPQDIIVTLNMDYWSLAQAGSMLGTGAVIVIAEDTCMVQVLARILQFYCHESCGQCTPCREGLSWALKVINNILQGKAKKTDLILLQDIFTKIANSSLCPLGDSASMIAINYFKYFNFDFMKYIN